MRLQDLKQGIASQVTSRLFVADYFMPTIIFAPFITISQIINEENAGGASVGEGEGDRDGEGDCEIKKVGPQFGSALFGSLLLRPDTD